MEHFTGRAGLPQLLASGALQCELAPGVTHFLVMSPMGQLLGEDSDSDLVRTVFRDIASAIKAIYEVGILHRWVGQKLLAEICWTIYRLYRSSSSFE